MRSGALRVLYVTQDDLSKNSGYAFRVDRLRRALEKAGARVEVVGYCSSSPAIASTARRSRSALRRLWPLWKGLTEPGDCVVITSIGAPYNGLYALLARLRGRRVVYDVHDPVQYVLPELFGTGPLVRAAMPLVALSERLLERCADAIVTASPAARDIYGRRNPHRLVELAYNVRTEPDGGAAERRNIREEFGWRDATVVVYAGGLQRWVRGIERQIEALTAARAQGANAVLLLLGYGERAYFESLGASLVREGALRFIDDVAPQAMRDILRQCDVAISCEPLGYLMPSKYFDYPANGVRIVAADDGRDVLRTLGAFADTYDGTPGGLVRCLLRRPGRMDDADVRRAREFIGSLDAETDKIAKRIVEKMGR